MKTAWLIELEHCGPVQALYWYISPNGCGGGWTTIASDARKYGSKSEAESHMSTWASRDGVVVREHCWQ